MLLNCGVGKDSRESLGDPTSQSPRKSVLSIHWKDWCWSWNSSTLATWWEELTNWKRPWYWERLQVGGEGDDRGWDGCMSSPTQWTWVCASSRSWWWTGRLGVLQYIGSQRVGQDWVTEMNWLAYRHIWITLKKKNYLLRLITLQYCGGFHHTSIQISHGCTRVPPSRIPLPSSSPSHPFRCPRALALSARFHAFNLDWSSCLIFVLDFYPFLSVPTAWAKDQRDRNAWALIGPENSSSYTFPCPQSFLFPSRWGMTCPFSLMGTSSKSLPSHL